MSRPLIIIPTYNERSNLPIVIRGIRTVLPQGDILIVDDNSPDGTGALARQLATQDSHLHLLERSKKSGLGKAYQAGMIWALEKTYDPICTMDADLSHDPAALPDLIAAWDTGADVAIGSRYVPGGQIHGWGVDRYILSMLANRFAKVLLSLKSQDVTAGFKAYRKKLLEKILETGIISEGYAFQIEMISRAQSLGAKIVEIPITFQDRTQGESKVSRHELVSSFRSLLALTRQRSIVREFGRFMLVGSLNFIVDIGTTNLLVIFGHLRPDIAGYIGTTLAVLNSFVLNRRWTFTQHRRDGLAQQFVRFITVNGTGALINAGAYTLFLRFGHLNYNWAKVVAILVSFSWNFLGTRSWVFRKSAHVSSIN